MKLKVKLVKEVRSLLVSVSNQMNGSNMFEQYQCPDLLHKSNPRGHTMCVAAGSLGPTSLPSNSLCPSRNDVMMVWMGMFRAAFMFKMIEVKINQVVLGFPH